MAQKGKSFLNFEGMDGAYMVPIVSLNRSKPHPNMDLAHIPILVGSRGT
jgi:hypothetical protein